MYKKNIKKLISSILALLIIITSLSLGLVVDAEEKIAIDESNFTDANFRTILSKAFDTDSDGYLSESERAKTVITISGYLKEYCPSGAKVESLKGIEYFTSLKRLYAAGIGLKSLDVSKNTNLVQITCGGNELSEITLGTLPSLTQLNCSANSLTSLDVSGCAALQQLQCYTNELTSLNLQNNTKLVLLYAQQNNLTSLDLSKNSALVSLYCASNKIKELDLSQNTSLSGITSEMIGNQWIVQTAFVSNNSIYINHSFKDSSKLVSSSLDTKQETEEGEETVSAYNGSAFVTSEVTGFKNKLENPDGEVVDGFTYKYNVNNSECQNMTVNIQVERSFYQVDFYYDETEQDRLSYTFVFSGNAATAPEIPTPAQCTKFVSWSKDFSSVTEDEDIYIVWAEDHNMVKTINEETGDVDIHCTKCDDKTVQFNFPDSYNTETGDELYNEKADLNGDGVINAKDYAILEKM